MKLETLTLTTGALPHVPTIAEVGRGLEGANVPTDSLQGMSTDLQRMLRNVDLTRVRPSQLRDITIKLFEEKRISEDAASEFLLARRPGAKLSDDRPFNLIDEMQQGLKLSGAVMQRYPFALTAQRYEEGDVSARGLNAVIAFLRKHPRLNERA